MKLPLSALCLAALSAFAVAQTATPDLPVWAYGTDPALARQAPKPAAPDTSPKHLPGTDATFTLAQIADRFGPADWFPQDHPAMPEIVAHGNKPQVWACSLCHYPNGKGRPENAGVSGLPVSYFIEQMHEFRDGDRHSADTRKKNTNLMAAYAKNMTDDEIKQAAEYFGAMKWTPWIKVVETAQVPKMYTSVGMYLPEEGSAKEPIGNRIIETPVNAEETEALRNPHSGFIAYVPVGALKKGEALAMNGGGKTTACAVCHGAGLKGLGPVPGIAGRSPSYVMRQLYDIQQGTRKGNWNELMVQVVKGLSTDEMMEVAAYTASLEP